MSGIQDFIGNYLNQLGGAVNNNIVKPVENEISTGAQRMGEIFTNPGQAFQDANKAMAQNMGYVLDNNGKIVGYDPKQGAKFAMSATVDSGGGLGESNDSALSSTMPSIKKPGLLTRVANKIDSNIGAARPTDIATNPAAQQEIGPMQESLSRHNVYNPSQAKPAMDRIFSQYINPAMKANPKQIPLESANGQSGLIDSIVSEMRQREPGLDPREAKNVASKFINNLYDVARNNTEPSQVVPNSIDSGALLKMKTNLNNTKALQQFFKDGTINTPEDLAAVASRNAMAQALEKAHPEIAQLIRDYGNIKEAYPSMYQDSVKASSPTKNPAVIATRVAKPVVAGTLRGLDTPVGKAALGGAAGLGLYEAGKHANSPQVVSGQNGNNNQGNTPDNQIDQTNTQPQTNSSLNESTNHTSSIPQSEADIKPDANGKYTVLDPFSLKSNDGTPLVLSDADYAKQRAAIQNQLNDPSVKFNPIASQKVESQLANLDTLHQSTGDINTAFNATKNLNNLFDDAEQTLSLTKPSIFTSPNLPVIGAPLAGLRESVDPQYSALVSKVRQLEQSAGLPAGSLYKPGQTADTLKQNLESARKKVLNQYYTIVNSVLGSTQQPASNPNQMPRISGSNVAGNNATPMPTPGMNLPPIVKGLQVEPIQGHTRVIQ